MTALSKYRDVVLGAVGKLNNGEALTPLEQKLISNEKLLDMIDSEGYGDNSDQNIDFLNEKGSPYKAGIQGPLQEVSTRYNLEKLGTLADQRPDLAQKLLEKEFGAGNVKIQDGQIFARQGEFEDFAPINKMALKDAGALGKIPLVGGIADELAQRASQLNPNVTGADPLGDIAGAIPEAGRAAKFAASDIAGGLAGALGGPLGAFAGQAAGAGAADISNQFSEIDFAVKQGLITPQEAEKLKQEAPGKAINPALTAGVLTASGKALQSPQAQKLIGKLSGIPAEVLQKIAQQDSPLGEAARYMQRFGARGPKLDAAKKIIQETEISKQIASKYGGQGNSEAGKAIDSALRPLIKAKDNRASVYFRGGRDKAATNILANDFEFINFSKPLKEFEDELRSDHRSSVKPGERDEVIATIKKLMNGTVNPDAAEGSVAQAIKAKYQAKNPKSDLITGPQDISFNPEAVTISDAHRTHRWLSNEIANKAPGALPPSIKSVMEGLKATLDDYFEIPKSEEPSIKFTPPTRLLDKYAGEDEIKKGYQVYSDFQKKIPKELQNEFTGIGEGDLNEDAITDNFMKTLKGKTRGDVATSGQLGSLMNPVQKREATGSALKNFVDAAGKTEVPRYTIPKGSTPEELLQQASIFSVPEQKAAQAAGVQFKPELLLKGFKEAPKGEQSLVPIVNATNLEEKLRGANFDSFLGKQSTPELADLLGLAERGKTANQLEGIKKVDVPALSSGIEKTLSDRWRETVGGTGNIGRGISNVINSPIDLMNATFSNPEDLAKKLKLGGK